MWILGWIPLPFIVVLTRLCIKITFNRTPVGMQMQQHGGEHILASVPRWIILLNNSTNRISIVFCPAMLDATLTAAGATWAHVSPTIHG
jgi:hypothetical protein